MSRRQPVFNLPGVILALLAVCFVVQLVRDFVFMEVSWVDLARMGVLVVYALIMWRIAIRAMERKLVD